MKSTITFTIFFALFAPLCLALSLAAPPFPITCAIIRCPARETCVETHTGPKCVSSPTDPLPPPPPTSCAVVLCAVGHICVQTPGGAQCVPIGGAGTVPPPPAPAATPTPPADCSQLNCASDEFCIETPAGPECTPDTGCAAVTCLVGSACVVTPTGPECQPINPSPAPPTPHPDTCACIQIFDPVCCQLPSGEKRTTGNDCECSGCGSGTVISRGACPPASCAAVDCAPGFSCVIKDAVAQCIEDEAPSCICPLNFDPVCCQTPSGFETKSNSCFCNCEPSSRVLRPGECPTIAPPSGPSDCFCLALYDPVCCKSALGLVSQASNSCRCECTGGTVVQSGCGINH